MAERNHHVGATAPNKCRTLLHASRLVVLVYHTQISVALLARPRSRYKLDLRRNHRYGRGSCRGREGRREGGRD